MVMSLMTGRVRQTVRHLSVTYSATVSANHITTHCETQYNKQCDRSELSLRQVINFGSCLIESKHLLTKRFLVVGQDY
jgi:hypothetical protein